MMAAPVKRRNSISIYDARIAGLYDLEKTIGRGHFAVVKLAKHVFTGEQVAVKVIDKTKLDPVSTTHIMQEVRCMKLVQHPHIVRLYEVIDTQTKLFLILELGDYDMYEYIMKFNNRGIVEAEAQKYFCQIIEAIDYCHRLHVVHRDLKPENVVFFENYSMVKLTDFGFSNLFTPGQQLETSCGSLAYSAPEILLGDAYDAPAVDVWSLGVILYMLVCGRLPFQEANDSETLTKILDCSFSLPSNISDDCRRLISRMLVRDPLKRATLSEISNNRWVKAGDHGHSSQLPLVGREFLPDAAHETIVEQMVAGGICSAESIISSLEKDDYSYITATYYLLAERVLKKSREDNAKRLLIRAGVNAKSDPNLDSTATGEMQNGLTILNEDTDDTAVCACTDVLAQGSDDERNETISGLISPVSKQPTMSTSWSSAPTTAAPSAGPPSRSNSWRHRPCSILKEESEEELSTYLHSSRPNSRGTSPRNSIFSLRDRISPTVIQELLELSDKVSTGQRTPESARGSRSPSPGPSGGRTSPSVVMGRFKTIGSVPPLRKLSSSPHLFGICEEGEEDGNDGGVGRTVVMRRSVPPPTTYSSVRMIRPRQAVVSPDVIRRYERVYIGSSGRSRRSTSCSSSEASDDDSERRYGLISSKYCGRRDGSDKEDDKEPPAGGGRRPHGRRSFSLGDAGSRESTNKEQKSSKGNKSAIVKDNSKQLDAGKLIGKLQKLVLDPIREIPSIIPNFLRSHWYRWVGDCDHDRTWFQRLRKPKSCEHLHRIDPTSSVDLTEYDAVNMSHKAQCDSNSELDEQDEDENEESEMRSVKLKPKNKKRRPMHKRCRAAITDLTNFQSCTPTPAVLI